MRGGLTTMLIRDYSQQVNVSFQARLMATYTPAPALTVVQRPQLRSRWQVYGSIVQVSGNVRGLRKAG